MLKTSRRYQSHELEEGQYEPGSHDRVLKNLLGIKKKREMNVIEFTSLSETMKNVLNQYDADHRFTALDLCNIHSYWLGDMYAWAGDYRQVNMSKGGFHFAAATLIPKLMNDFENQQLKKFTPCSCVSQEEMIKALAEVHTEFILIHPFREGNGRLGRLLANLMAVQAGLPLLDFSGIKGEKRTEYFLAVQAGIERNYTPMEKIFYSIIKRTLKGKNQS